MPKEKCQRKKICFVFKGKEGFMQLGKKTSMLSVDLIFFFHPIARNTLAVFIAGNWLSIDAANVHRQGCGC